MSADDKYFSYGLEMSTELDWIVWRVGRRKRIQKTICK